MLWARQAERRGQLMADLWDALILRLGRFLLRLAHVHIG